jgi:hypothetical protein
MIEYIATGQERKLLENMSTEVTDTGQGIQATWVHLLGTSCMLSAVERVLIGNETCSQKYTECIILRNTCTYEIAGHPLVKRALVTGCSSVSTSIR